MSQALYRNYWLRLWFWSFIHNFLCFFFLCLKGSYLSSWKFVTNKEVLIKLVWRKVRDPNLNNQNKPFLALKSYVLRVTYIFFICMNLRLKCYVFKSFLLDLKLTYFDVKTCFLNKSLLCFNFSLWGYSTSLVLEMHSKKNWFWNISNEFKTFKKNETYWFESLKPFLSPELSSFFLLLASLFCSSEEDKLGLASESLAGIGLSF